MDAQLTDEDGSRYALDLAPRLKTRADDRNRVLCAFRREMAGSDCGGASGAQLTEPISLCHDERCAGFHIEAVHQKTDVFEGCVGFVTKQSCLGPRGAHHVKHATGYTH